jgi:hypothetical protein
MTGPAPVREIVLHFRVEVHSTVLIIKVRKYGVHST